MKKPNVYARAAKLLEKDESVRFPCHAICVVKRREKDDWIISKDCYRLLKVFVENKSMEYMSEDFLEYFGYWDGRVPFEFFRDHSILALCFAAAMLDAGDI